MQQFLLLFVSFFTLLMVHGQGVVHQKGYVRSVGRPDNKSGKRLPGAVIKVNGQHNTVRSGQNGQFTLEFNGLREGKDSYSFTSVRLAGYDLQENGMLGRRYPLSSTVPVEVVLVPQALKLEIEERVRHTVETEYQKKLKRIEALRAKDAERYRAELLRLESEYEKRDQLINDMVERYASTDYAHLDSLSARINELIELGELERADSLINAQDIARLESEHAALQARTEQLRADLSQSESATQTSLHQLMSLYEGKRDIHIARYENDSAAVYWEKIVKLDTTNVDNLLKAGLFVQNYRADYDRAMELFQMALRNGAKQFGEESSDVATCYIDMGCVCIDQGQYALALEYHDKALSIDIKAYGEEHPKVAMSYNNIASVFRIFGQNAWALEYYDKALSILLKMYGEVHPYVATSYDNIGLVYASLGKYDLALENHEKALSIRLKVYGEEHIDVARSYNNIGLVYSDQGQYALALDNYDKALYIFLKVYGEEHPNVATIYNNIGSVYSGQEQYALALENSEKALSIYLKVYGVEHPHVAACYYNIGSVYSDQGRYALALDNYEKALSIWLKVYGEEHPDVARSYNNIGFVYADQGQYVLALDNYMKAFSICNQLYGEDKLGALMYAYLCYSKYYAQSPEASRAGYEDFIANHMVTATVVPDGRAAKLGLEGMYYVLEFGDWQAGSMESVSEVSTRMKGKPKVVVLYREGKFIKEHFEGQVGVQWGVKSIAKEERKAIVKTWKEWRK